MEREILIAGGTTPLGDALYRLCLAQERVTRASGFWNIWREDLTLEQRGGIDIEGVVRMLENGMTPQTIDDYIEQCLAARPEKIVSGMMQIPVYPDIEGWILEKWKPAPCSRNEWYALTLCGGPAAGVYPEQGEYVLVAGPTPYPLTAKQAVEAIRREFREIQERPQNPRERTRRRLERIASRERAKVKRIADGLRDRASDGPMSLRSRISLGAGRVRQAWADKIGLKGHYGN